MLAYALSSVQRIGVTGIWVAIPIGWIIADIIGISYYFMKEHIVYRYAL